MKTKLSPRIFLATSAIALGIATSAMAMPFGGDRPDGGKVGHHMMFSGKGMARLHDDLKLDVKQEAAWQQANTANKEAMAGMRERMTKHHDEIKAMIDGVEDKARVGVCLDTMHTFAAGFDIRTRDGFLKTMEHFDKTVGMQYLRGLHLNDSKVGLNSHVDRHESLGAGLLGIEVFTCIMTDKRFENMPLVLETPNEELWAQEIRQLMEMAGR